MWVKVEDHTAWSTAFTPKKTGTPHEKYVKYNLKHTKYGSFFFFFSQLYGL